MNLTTRELSAFLTLTEQRNFTRAAALCHLSQPAFSALVRGLEEAMGARLFDRTTRSVELTAEGRVLVEPARRLLRDAESALADVRDHAARRRGRVAIALLPSLAAGWLPSLLAKFHQKYPGIEIDVADVLSDACIERVRAGTADFALASTRTATPELHTEEFCRDQFHLVCPCDHVLARRRSRIQLKDLAPHPIVHLARSSSVRQYVEAALYPMQLHTMMELDQLSTVAGMVRAGLGITIVPSLTLFHFADPQLATRPLHAPALVRRVYLVRRADRPLSTAAAGLHQMVMAARPRVPRGVR
ncbi:MAG TPA: LysR substrate-binding domain-containing protein [Burkholderiaceae bacterium]|nr:LysR substrate-binding domain-containing protein [Burkholderiaceae bacterium]